jgi:hypothetical protein
MIDRRIFVATSLAALTAAPAAAQAAFTTIFDGKSLDGWTKLGDTNVALVDGTATADKGNGHLVWKDQYGDFELKAEIWTSEDANSGIFVRFPDKQKPGSKDGYEFNIFDKRPDPTYGTGAIVDVAKSAVPIVAAGKWNTMEIICKGAELTFKLNGQTTVDKVSNVANGHTSAMRGYISLQFGGGTVKFRNVQIRAL